MKPILFSKTATAFNTNGKGRLDAISCVVTEERNGMFELEMQIAETALHADEIEMDSIIVVKPNQKDSQQAFRVYKMKKPMKGIYAITARHISYQLSFITTMPFEVAASASACSNTLAGLKSNCVDTCPFNFSTDVHTVAGYKQTAPASIRSRLGGVEGSVLDQFGGEYKWDNWDIYFLKNRGVVTPQVSLRYGKNIIDLDQEENIENTVTGIVPYWRDSEGANLVTLTEKYVEIPNASSYPYKKIIPYDFSQAFEEKPTEVQLRAKAQAYVGTSGLGTPKVSIKLSFVNLSDTVDYKDIAAFQAVGLCDNVIVQFEKLGISTTAEIVKYEYDVLTEKYNSVEIGSLRSSLMTTISGNIQDIEGVPELITENNINIIDEAKDYTDGKLEDYPTEQDLETAIDTATGWLTSSNGKIMARKDANGNWKELFFLSATATASSGNVLRINENGIGFGRNGWNGAFTQAWTLDGKLIIGGTNVPEFVVYTSDNEQTRQILFKVSRDGITWNLPNSSMTQNGALTIKGATITGGSFKIENPNYGQTVIDINYPDATVQYLLEIDGGGMAWNTINSSMTSDGELTVTSATITDADITQANLSGCSITDGVFEVGSEISIGDPFYFKIDSTTETMEWQMPNSSMAQDGTLTITGAYITGGSLLIENPNYGETIIDPNYPDATVQYLLEITGGGMAWNTINSILEKDGSITTGPSTGSQVIITDGKVFLSQNSINCGKLRSFLQQDDANKPWVSIEGVRGLQFIAGAGGYRFGFDGQSTIGAIYDDNGTLRLQTATGNYSLEATKGVKVSSNGIDVYGASEFHTALKLDSSLTVDGAIKVIHNNVEYTGVSGTYTIGGRSVEIRHGIVTGVT